MPKWKVDRMNLLDALKAGRDFQQAKLEGLLFSVVYSLLNLIANASLSMLQVVLHLSLSPPLPLIPANNVRIVKGNLLPMSQRDTSQNVESGQTVASLRTEDVRDGCGS